MIINKIVWGVVRRDSYNGREYALASEVGDGPELVKGIVDLNRDTIPQWHNANPVVRIVRFRLTELTD